MKNRIAGRAGSVTVAFALAPLIASAAPPSFNGLGDLPGGRALSAATAVNANGSVVVGYSGSENGSEEAFRWTQETGMYGLGGIPDARYFLSDARAVSADGRVVIGEGAGPQEPADPNAFPFYAFRWTMDGDGPNGTIESLGDLPGGNYFSVGRGCTADGQTVIGHSGSAASGTLGADAYRKVGDQPMQSLGDLPGGTYFSVATGISADGVVIAGYSSSTLSGPASSASFVWTEDNGMEDIGDLDGGGYGSNAFAISADGTTVVGVGVDGTGVVAFRWTRETGMVSIGDLPGDLSSGRANGVSGDGSIIVGQGYQNGGFKAFIWDAEHGMRNLKDVLISDYALGDALDGWTLEVATGISTDGSTIVGYGPNPQGDYEAWRAFLGDACTLPGDLDGDLDVDLADLATLLSNFGLTDATPAQGDVDDDNDVDLADLAMLLANFGATCP